MAETIYTNGGPTDVVPTHRTPKRTPITREEFDSYRPVPAVPGIGNKDNLHQILGPGCGLPRAAAAKLAAIILQLQERIAEVERKQQPVALAGVETR